MLRCRWLLTLWACRGAATLVFADGLAYSTSQGSSPGQSDGYFIQLEESSGSFRVTGDCSQRLEWSPLDNSRRILLSTPGMVPAACAACSAGFTWADGSSSCTMTFSLPLLVLNCIQILVLCIWYCCIGGCCECDNGICICDNDKKTEQCRRCSELCDREGVITTRTVVLHVLHAATTIVGLLLSAIVVSQQPSPGDVDLAALIVSLVGFVGTVAITVFRKQIGGGHVCCSCLMKDASTSKVMDVECMCEKCRSVLRRHEAEKAVREEAEARVLQEILAVRLEEEAREACANPTPEHRKPKTENPNPKTETGKRKPKNRNPKPEPRRPKPGAVEAARQEAARREVDLLISKPYALNLHPRPLAPNHTTLP